MSPRLASQPLSLPPGPAGDPIVGNLARLRRDPLGFLVKVADDFGDVVHVPMGPSTVVLVRSPEGVRHVLQENVKNYTKQTRGFDRVRMLLGQGLLTSEGAFWLRQRRLAQPAFHRQRLQGFGALMVRATEELADEWDRAAATGRARDVAADMMRLTLRIASESLFSADLSSEAGEIGPALATSLRYANDRITRIFSVPAFVPTRENRRAQAAMATLDKVVHGLIDRRRREASRDDLLSMLMDAKDEETGERMSDGQLRDEVMTLLLAGHETTANLLAWTWMLLSRHPDVGRRLRAELAFLAERSATFDDLPRLAFTRQVVDEALRLYPPAWVFSRAPTEDDEIGGHRIPAGSFVMLSPYVTHRDRRLWPNPEGFDPDRFLPERAQAMARYAYFPFGGGPRQCIGNNFALAEATLTLATLARRFRPELVPARPPTPEATITLRPKDGLWMTVERA